MIGIYKITNNKNGMSYIGQSVHCGKRFDEHYKGDQLIDKIMRDEGIENFKFEIIQEVNKSELSIWEDYYIMKYNTMSPNGYNKRWNCSAKTREKLFDTITKQKVIPKIETSINVDCSYTKNEILFYLAKIKQQDCYEDNRILNQQQLDTFYKAQRNEIETRRKILDAYDNSCLKDTTSAAKRRAEQIAEIVQEYNNGASTWSVTGLDELEHEEDYNSIATNGLLFFEERCNYIPDFGMPAFITYDLQERRSFNNDGITIYCQFLTEPIFNTYRTLFNIGYLNPEKVWFLDKNDNRMDVKKKYIWKEHGYLRLIITP